MIGSYKRGQNPHAKRAERNGHGENIAMFWGKTQKEAKYGRQAANNWYDEIEDYQFSDGTSANGKTIGHFTQVSRQDI